MRTYTIRDERGHEYEIAERQLYRHFKLLLSPILSEIGLDATTIAKYDGDIYRLVGLVVAQLREYNSTIQTARIEFKKLRDKREDDLNLILSFIRGTAKAHDADAHVVTLPERKAA